LSTSAEKGWSLRVLVVGGHSSLAEALIPVLSEFAHVTTAGRTQCDLHLDLRAPAERVTLPSEIDVVVNTAACFGSETPDEMVQTEDVNALGVLKLSRACTVAGVKHLVHVSSMFAGLGEDSPFYGLYALSKRHSEEVARLYCAKFCLPLAILRPSQIYGEGEKARKHQPFLSSIIERVATNQDVLLFGSRAALRNLIHVDDVSRIIASVVRLGIEGTYSCASTENASYADIAAAAIEAFGSSSSIRFVPDKPDIPDNVFEPDDTLYRSIGFYPQISIADGMRREAAYREAVR
jgi:nucleoside-diphosphate-sugar epimerase